MLSNRINDNYSLDTAFDLNITELRAFKKISHVPAAAYSLTQYLQHTDAEADKILTDPVYTESDMKLIAAIGPMLAGDLNLIIDSFYLDIPPKEPVSCVEIFNRMVESFPLEPIVLTASNGDKSIYENGPTMSRGLIRRLLRAKKFNQTCEGARIETRDYYYSVWANEEVRLADEYRDSAVLVFTPFEIGDSAMSTNHLDAVSSTFFNFITMTKQNDFATALVAMSFFGICALYTLRRPANCLRKGLASVIGLFKAANQVHDKKAVEEYDRVLSI